MSKSRVGCKTRARYRWERPSAAISLVAQARTLAVMEDIERRLGDTTTQEAAARTAGLRARTASASRP